MNMNFTEGIVLQASHNNTIMITNVSILNCIDRYATRLSNWTTSSSLSFSSSASIPMMTTTMTTCARDDTTWQTKIYWNSLYLHSIKQILNAYFERLLRCEIAYQIDKLVCQSFGQAYGCLIVCNRDIGEEIVVLVKLIESRYYLSELHPWQNCTIYFDV